MYDRDGRARERKGERQKRGGHRAYVEFARINSFRICSLEKSGIPGNDITSNS